MILRTTNANTVMFWCPGCNTAHQISIAPHPGAWSWNLDLIKPTFQPSVRVQKGHYASGHTGSCWCDYNNEHPEAAYYKCGNCHSFITEGMIQFLDDCTHALKGQTVALPEFPQSDIL